MKTANDFQEPIDEICSDSMYQNETTTEDVNPAELAREWLTRSGLPSD